MTEWDPLRYDVRVRKRMLHRRLLSQADLERHLAELVDVEGYAEAVSAGQPALGARSSREPQAIVTQPLPVGSTDPSVLSAEVEAVASNAAAPEPTGDVVPQSPDRPWSGEDPS